MNCKPIMSGVPLIDIERSRYEELIRKEERLKMIEEGLQRLHFYNSDFELFKNIYGLKEVIEVRTDEN